LKVFFIKLLNAVIFYLKIYRFLGTRHRVVLLYHRVERDRLIKKYRLKGIFVSDVNFERQMQYLSKSSRKNKVIVTFDDGYKDTYLHAVPILNKYSVRAIFFVTTNFINRKMYMWIDVLNQYANQHSLSEEEFKNLSKYIKSLSLSERSIFLTALSDAELPYDSSMSWEDLAIVSQSHVVGNHTASHPNFSNESPETIKEEILDAKKEIENELSVSDIYFAYPDGDLGKNPNQTKAILQSLGYKYCFTARRGVWREVDDSYFINRIPIHYWDDLPTFVNKCHGINIEDGMKRFRVSIVKECIKWVKRKLRF